MAKDRLKRIIRKKSTGVITTLLAFGVTLGAILITSNVALAQDSLPGISNIRDDMLSTDTPYRVLEIVPELKYAEFGFLVDGQEPLQDISGNMTKWQEYLSLHTEDLTEAERVNYMESLATTNADYVGTSAADGKPLIYTTYQEVAEGTAGASVIYGNQRDVHGYFAKSTAGDLEKWNAKFTLVPPADYSYDELIANNVTPYYIVDSAVALVDETSFSAYPESYYVYQLVNAATNEYSCFGSLKDLKDVYDAAPVDDKPDVTDYYIVSFRLITSSDYGAGAAIVTPSVYSASDFTYDEVNGPYKVEETLETEKGHNMIKPSRNIYYTGGFTSDNWMLRYVFDIDEADCGNYSILVDTKTAAEVNSMTSAELDGYQFIYINSGTRKGSGFNYSYTDTTKDLTKNTVKMIFEKICNNQIPCILDYSLVGNASGDNTNSGIYALALMLMQENYNGILSSDKTLDINKISFGSSDMTTWQSQILQKNNYNYVNKNVMVINTTTGNYLTTNFHTLAYDSTQVSDGYSAVLEEIKTENLFRLSDQGAGYTPLDENIYKSTVVRYIINFAGARKVVSKTYVNVLEIQPAVIQYKGNDSKHAGTDELTPNIVRYWMGVNTSVDVNITTMTTTEFIGNITDLNAEYDLIYIGADIYGFTKNNGKTDFTDNNLDGMIYTNVGDIKTVDSRLSGHLDSDYTRTNRTEVKQNVDGRFSGNDITADKHNDLVDYVRGTYPIVVADALCQDATTPSDETLDNCTYLYSFLKENLSKKNVFRVADVKDGKNTEFKFYAKRAKLSIGTPVVSSETASVTTGTAFVIPGVLDTTDETDGHVTYITKENGKFYLRYKFTITNEGAVYDSTKYTAKLYLDSNADGKFSEQYEEISGTTITNVATGKTVTNGQLVAGVQYTLSRQVPDTYNGVLTWKVSVNQTDNQFIRDSVKGYTKLEDSSKPATEIKVLQIKKDSNYSLDLQQGIGNTKYSGNNEILRTLVWGGTYGGVKYEGITDEYIFHFTTLTHSQINQAFSSGWLNGQKFDLMDYDMLILGFYDSYNVSGSSMDLTNEVVNGTATKNGIKQYIDLGKSVLFAHDTTSFTAVPERDRVTVQGTGQKIYTGSYSASCWAYALNKNIREMIGLDKYGISLEVKDGIDYTAVRSGKDLSTTSEGQQLMAALKNELHTDGDYKYYEVGLKELAYKPGSNKTQTIGETQAFTYEWMQKWSPTSNRYRNPTKSPYNSYHADRINEGQITTYPYYLAEDISIARTHAQYFTLDLNADDDGDGETDLVVWYTMGGTGHDRYTPNDVLNNYYIFNKGNITYTGFGDIAYESDLANCCTIDEGKLFINTIVAAYHTGVKEPEVTVYESENDLSPTTTFYEYGDVDNGVAFRENSQRMYFSVNDTNVIRGTKSAVAEYYVALNASAANSLSAGATSYTVGGKTYAIYRDSSGVPYMKLTDLKTYTTKGKEVDANNLECDVVYYVDIPTTVFDMEAVSGQNVNTFMLAAKTVLNKTGSITGNVTVVETTTTYNKIEFVHVELFPLD